MILYSHCFIIVLFIISLRPQKILDPARGRNSRKNPLKSLQPIPSITHSCMYNVFLQFPLSDFWDKGYNTDFLCLFLSYLLRIRLVLLQETHHFIHHPQSTTLMPKAKLVKIQKHQTPKSVCTCQSKLCHTFTHIDKNEVLQAGVELSYMTFRSHQLADAKAHIRKKLCTHPGSAPPLTTYQVPNHSTATAPLDEQQSEELRTSINLVTPTPVIDDTSINPNLPPQPNRQSPPENVDSVVIPSNHTSSSNFNIVVPSTCTAPFLEAATLDDEIMTSIPTSNHVSGLGSYDTG